MANAYRQRTWYNNIIIILQCPTRIYANTRDNIITFTTVCGCVCKDDTWAKCELLLITVNYTPRNISDGDPKMRSRLRAVVCLPTLNYLFICIIRCARLDFSRLNYFRRLRAQVRARLFVVRTI